MNDRRRTARISAELRRAIQESPESVRQLAARHGIDPKTVLRWRKRSDERDAPLGPRRSSILTEEEEDMVVGFRHMTHLPLDDCLYALQPIIPRLTRSMLHRCLRRHGVQRLPVVKRSGPAVCGRFYIAITEEVTDEGASYHFIAIDRVSRLLHANLFDAQDEPTACRFLQEVIAAVPYRIDAVETLNAAPFSGGRFSEACGRYGVRHMASGPDIVPRQIGIAPEIRRARHQYPSRQALLAHIHSFRDCYNRERRLKTLGGLTPHEFVSRVWAANPDRFQRGPYPLFPEPDNSGPSR